MSGGATSGTDRAGSEHAADDIAERIWEQAGSRLHAELAEATWRTWFQGVRAVRFEHDVLVLSVPNHLAADRIRSSYRPMLDDALHGAIGRAVAVELLVDTDERAAEPAFETPPLEVPAARGRAGRRAQERVDLGVGDAEPPLHLRGVRHRRVEPLRPRRGALGRRGAGPGLQPALHLRTRRAGQDAPAPCHRPLRPEPLSEEARPVRLHRVVHERLRRGHPGPHPDAGLQASLPRARRAAHRRHPVPRAHPGAPGGVLPHVQPDPRRGRPDRDLVGPVAEVDRHARGPAPEPVRVGADHRRPAPRVRDPPRHPPQEGRGRAPGRDPRRGARVHRQQHPGEHP